MNKRNGKGCVRKEKLENKQRERNPGDIKTLDNSRFSDLEKWPSCEKTRPNDTQPCLKY